MARGYGAWALELIKREVEKMANRLGEKKITR